MKNSLTPNDDTKRTLKYILSTISPADWAYLNQDLKDHIKIPLDYVLIDREMRKLICGYIGEFLVTPLDLERFLSPAISYDETD